MNENLKLTYPYWGPDFYKEFKGYTVWFKDESNHLQYESADAYRVYRIICNREFNKTGMEVLEILKNATEENPIVINGEPFWSEKDS